MSASLRKCPVGAINRVVYNELFAKIGFIRGRVDKGLIRSYKGSEQLAAGDFFEMLIWFGVEIQSKTRFRNVWSPTGVKKILICYFLF